MTNAQSSTALEAQQVSPRSRRHLVWVVVAIAIVGSMLFMCVGPNSIVAKWIFPGVYTSDFSDYADMRTLMMNRYPWAPDFLPSHIPDSAVIHAFEATDDEMLQASPGLLLEMILSPKEAQEELSRLQKIEPNGRFSNTTDFPFFSSEDKIAKASYKPETHMFYYQISGD